MSGWCVSCFLWGCFKNCLFFAIGRSKFIFFMEQILNSIIIFVLERREYIAISDQSKQSRSGNDTGTTVDGWLAVALAGISSAADASPSKIQTVTKGIITSTCSSPVSQIATRPFSHRGLCLVLTKETSANKFFSLTSKNDRPTTSIH